VEASVIETVAKYFYFFSLDEQITFSASLKALAEIKSNDWLDLKFRSEWIAVLTKWKPRLQYLHKKKWTGFPDEKGISVPKNLDINGWNHFVNNADQVEVEAVLLSRILGFSDQEIAQGLAVSQGTVRYRVGRGLRHLGGFLES
jgi:hypothetical protein